MPTCNLGLTRLFSNGIFVVTDTCCNAEYTIFSGGSRISKESGPLGGRAPGTPPLDPPMISGIALYSNHMVERVVKSNLSNLAGEFFLSMFGQVQPVESCEIFKVITVYDLVVAR